MNEGVKRVGSIDETSTVTSSPILFAFHLSSFSDLHCGH